MTVLTCDFISFNNLTIIRQQSRRKDYHYRYILCLHRISSFNINRQQTDIVQWRKNW